MKFWIVFFICHFSVIHGQTHYVTPQLYSDGLSPQLYTQVSDPNVYGITGPFVQPAPVLVQQQHYAIPVQQQYAVPLQQQFIVPAQPQYVVPVQQQYSVPLQQQYAIPVKQHYLTPVQQYYQSPLVSYGVPVQSNTIPAVPVQTQIVQPVLPVVTKAVVKLSAVRLDPICTVYPFQKNIPGCVLEKSISPQKYHPDTVPQKISIQSTTSPPISVTSTTVKTTKSEPTMKSTTPSISFSLRNNVDETDDTSTVDDSEAGADSKSAKDVEDEEGLQAETENDSDV